MRLFTSIQVSFIFPMNAMWKGLLFFAALVGGGLANECVPYLVENQIVACVCNATYCDGLPKDQPDVPETVGDCYWYVTNKEGLRMKPFEVSFDDLENIKPDVELVVDASKNYQRIVGFGGAFTDAFGINMAKLSQATQEQLLRAYYDPKVGSGYSLGRVPIAATDFSTKYYSYDDVADDLTLANFNLAKEDYDYKIPYMKKALELRPDTLFISAAWSAPSWMKASASFNQLTLLKPEYYQLYADYLIKFLDEYKKNGIDFWAISTGNEPLMAFVIGFPLITMGWEPKTMAKWIGENMGPALEASQHDTLLLAFDDDREALPWFVEPTLENDTVSKYVAGTAVHWYMDYFAPAKLLDQTHFEFPDKFLLMTEASQGPPIWNTPNITLESWQRAEKYALGMIEHFKHWSIGWFDWNLALNAEGTPNWINNPVDAPIIVNADTDEFYKQPNYYAMAHFSKFVSRGSVRLNVTDTETVQATAFLTPAKETVVVVYNGDTTTKEVVLKDKRRGKLHLVLTPKSINTLKYK